MSLRSWKKEFYKPIQGVRDYRTHPKNWTDQQCFEHTLKKYSGLLPENLVKHSVSLLRGDVSEGSSSGPIFEFDGNSCALCKKFAPDQPGCDKCPLFKSGYGCNTDKSLWKTMMKLGNPRPMIKHMKKLIAECTSTGRWRKKKAA
jgi:hypothetical protein